MSQSVVLITTWEYKILRSEWETSKYKSEAKVNVEYKKKLSDRKTYNADFKLYSFLLNLSPTFLIDKPTHHQVKATYEACEYFIIINK